MLDHIAYPHIVEWIASYAPLELRTASRHWASHVDLSISHWRLEQGADHRLTAYVPTPRGKRRAWAHTAGAFEDCGLAPFTPAPPSGNVWDASWGSPIVLLQYLLRRRGAELAPETTPSAAPGGPPARPFDQPMPDVTPGAFEIVTNFHKVEVEGEEKMGPQPWALVSPPSEDLDTGAGHPTWVEQHTAAPPVDLALATHHIHTLDVVGGLNVDFRWASAFKRVKVVRFFPSLDPRNDALFFAPPTVVVFCHRFGPAIPFALPHGVQHVVLSIGPVWTGPPEGYAKDVVFATGSPLVLPLPKSVKHVSIILRDFKRSDHSKRRFDYWVRGVLVPLSHRTAMHDLSITFVNYPAEREGEVTPQPDRYRAALQRVAGGVPRSSYFFPCTNDAAEATAILQSTQLTTAVGEKDFRYIFEEEWLEEVGDHIHALATDEKYFG